MVSLAPQSLNDMEWEKFNNKSVNGTIFHSLKFFKYHPKNRYKFCNLKIYLNNKLSAILPGAIIDDTFISPSGASYGSFVTNDIGLELYEKIIDEAEIFLRHCGIKKIQLTPPPQSCSIIPNQIEAYLLSYKKYDVKYHLISNAVYLPRFESVHDIINKFDDSCRRAVRKSFKSNISIVQDNLIDTFYPILVENKKKFNTLPTHTYVELKKLFKLFPDQLKLFVSKLPDGKVIAGVLVMILNTHCLLAFYISHKIEYQEHRSINRLLYEIIKWAKYNNYYWFDLGVSMNTFSDNPMEPSRSLIRFKESFASRGIVRTTFFKKLS